MDSTVLLDYEHALAELGGDAEVYDEVLETFLDDTPSHVERMRAAAAAADWQTLGRLAHSLKSSARTIGGMALGAQAEALEVACRGGACPDAGARVAALASAFGTLREALASRRGAGA